MLENYTEQIEVVGLYGFYIGLFLFMGISIHDVLKQGDVPRFGRYIVWAVLLFGTVGFVFKGIIELLFIYNSKLL